MQAIQTKKYTYKLCTIADESVIVSLNNEGVGVSGIARITGMSKANVINKIKALASKLVSRELQESQEEYEVDEMHTIVEIRKMPATLLTL